MHWTLQHPHIFLSIVNHFYTINQWFNVNNMSSTIYVVNKRLGTLPCQNLLILISFQGNFLCILNHTLKFSPIQASSLSLLSLVRRFRFHRPRSHRPLIHPHITSLAHFQTILMLILSGKNIKLVAICKFNQLTKFILFGYLSN